MHFSGLVTCFNILLPLVNMCLPLALYIYVVFVASVVTNSNTEGYGSFFSPETGILILVDKNVCYNKSEIVSCYIKPGS